MQCERCGMLIDTASASPTSVQCPRCGHVVSQFANSDQPVFVLDPDDSDIFSFDDKTRVDTPPVKKEVAVGRVSTHKSKARLGDMLFLDAPPEQSGESGPPENHHFTTHSDMYHFDAVARSDALKLPGAESTAPHRLPPGTVATVGLSPERVPGPQPHEPGGPPPATHLEPDTTVFGAMIGATLTIITLVLMGLGLFRLTLGLTPPTTQHGLEQFAEALRGGEAPLAETDGVIVSSYRSITYPTGSSRSVLLIFGEVENHRDIDIENMVIEALLVDELGKTVAKESMPIGVKFSPPEFAAIKSMSELSRMVADKSREVSGIIPARSSREWIVVLPAPLQDTQKLEHRISLLQKEPAEN